MGKRRARRGFFDFLSFSARLAASWPSPEYEEKYWGESSMVAVLQELSHYLQSELEESMRSHLRGDSRISVYLVHPQDLDRAGELPVAGLYLWEASPESRFRSSGATLESTEEGGGREYLRRAPLWVTCRYVLAIRGRRAEEEQGLIASVLQRFYDQPSVPLESLPSLTKGEAFADIADRFPVLLKSPSDLWRTLGLSRHRLLIDLEVTVPLPSGRRQPAVRVLERQIDLQMKTESESDSNRGTTETSPHEQESSNGNGKGGSG